MLKRLCLIIFVLCVGYGEDLAQKCENGDSEACKELFVASQKSCDEGFVLNCHNLGILYTEGKGVKIDYKKAREYFQKACDDEFAAACVNLGILYARGEGVRQNLSTAKEYFGKGCDFGEQEGCKRYKLLNQKGF